MTSENKINCKECLGDRHDNCLNENCLCRNNNHGVKPQTLKDGVRVDFNKPIDSNFYKELNQVNDEILREPKSYQNKDFDKVADLIQRDIQFVTIRENKEIWFYSKSEGIYKPLGHTFIEELCQELIYKCTKKTVAEIVDTIRRNKTMIYMADLLDSKIINTQNRILDPNTFEEKLHSPEYLTTTKLPFSINHNARNLKLWNHILTIIDPKDINLVMELIWICISWNNPFKKMFIFKGESNTQKTTLADILAWIIGNNNVSRQKPESFLLKGSRFGTSKFIGKRMNIASEIGNLTEEMIENQKSLIGAELQNTERKGDNAERYFDPSRFVFLYTTNKLGNIYSSINDNSVITRFQFLIFRNKIDDSEASGQWYETFFDNDKDKQSAIDTIVSIVINYKKARSLGKIPKTRWSTIAQTKQILKEVMPKEEKYFEDERITPKEDSRLSLTEIKNDFEKFVGYTINTQQLGIILKKNGVKSTQSNGITYYRGYAFNTKNQTTLSFRGLP
jgi:hypothetical protein